MISKNHKNRSPHNWLAYDISDNFLDKFIPLYKGVLYDLGCGESPYKEFFLEYTEKYVAVDWASSYHTTILDVEADLNEPLPISSCVADTVVSLSVLEHLREPQLMLSEAYRILKTGGAIVSQIPWQWCVHEAPYDYFRYTPYGLEYLFKKVGFVDVKVEAQAGFFTMMILKTNYFSLRLIRGPKPLRFIIKTGFSFCWYIGQKLAPLLDKLDRDWSIEASGYYITAYKL